MVETAMEQEFKQTEVGEIPVDWEVKKIAAVTEKVGSGITPTGGVKVYKSEGRTFLRSQNVGWGKLLLEDVAFIDEATHSTFSSTEIFDNDVFLNITGASIGRSAIADERVVAGNVNQHVCIIRVKPDALDPYYLMCFLLSKQGQKQIDNFQAGGNRQGLNFGQIRSIQIPLPPTKAEQTAIATALSDMDGLISSLEKLIEKKRAIKQGAMQELLKPKEWWVVKKLEEICSLEKSRINPITISDNYKCVELEHIAQVTGRLLGYTDSKNLKSQKSIFRKGNVLWGKLRPYLRKYYFAEFDGVCTTEIWVVIPNNEVDSKWLYYLLQTDRLVEAANLSTGTKMPRADWKTVSDTEVAIPDSKNEQTHIAQTLSDMDTEIEALEKQLSKYHMLKQGMMQTLLTGKVRLV